MILNVDGILGPGFGKQSSRHSTAAAAPTPPGSPLHWFDLSDTSVLFQDEAAASPVTASGQTILRINNKGSSAEYLNNASEGPTYTTTVDTPLTTGAGDFSATSHIKTAVEDLTTDGEHYSVAMVASSAAVETFSIPFEWHLTDVAYAFSGNDAVANYSDGESTSGSLGLVNDTFYAFVTTHDDEASPTTEMYQSHTSSVVEATHVLAGQPSPGEKIALGERASTETLVHVGQIAEVIIWDTILSAGEIADYKTYVTAKYGISWA